MMRRNLLIVSALSFCSACYTYAPAPADLSTVTTGKLVRARISGEQAERVQPLIGREAKQLDGTLVGTNADSILIEVPSTARTVTGGGQEVLHQRLSISRSGITEMQVKTLSRGRTAAVAVIGAAGIGYILLDALNIGPGKESSPTQPGGQDFRGLTLLRIHR